MQQGIVDRDPARQCFVEHSLAAAFVASEPIQRQRTLTYIDVTNRLAQRFVADHRQQRTKDLLLHHAHLRRHVQQQLRCHAARGSGFGFQINDPRTPLSRILHQLQQPLVMPAAHNRCVVRIRFAVRVKPMHSLLHRIHERLHLRLRHQHVVRRDAGLARIEKLAPGEALDHRRQITGFINDRW